MSTAIFGAVFLTGLLGGVHCAGMCGGIVAAFSGQARAGRWDLHLSYNLGRILSYGVAGAVAGGLGSVGMLLEGVLPVQVGLYVLANLMLVLLGLYLSGVTQVAARLERTGARLWKALQPLSARLLPAKTRPRALALGMVWGWLPCGLVYGILLTALVAGDALNGAAIMLAFGLGTLPNLLFAGLAWRRVSGFSRARPVRLTAGGLVLGFGVYGLANAATLSQHIKSGLLCLT
jgi:hypothetical protein